MPPAPKPHIDSVSFGLDTSDHQPSFLRIEGTNFGHGDKVHVEVTGDSQTSWDGRIIGSVEDGGWLAKVNYTGVAHTAAAPGQPRVTAVETVDVTVTTDPGNSTSNSVQGDPDVYKST